MPTSSRHLLDVGIVLPESMPDQLVIGLATMTGRLGFATLHLAAVPDAGLMERLIESAAPSLVVVDRPDAETGADVVGVVRVNDPAAVTAERQRMDAYGVARPLQVCVPISIGRTMNEAMARADLEPRFQGDRHPRDVGIFGTFEQAQEQVLALARAGADELVLDVPLERDVADVLAQIRALVVGATPQLRERPATPERTAPPPTVFYGS